MRVEHVHVDEFMDTDYEGDNLPDVERGEQHEEQQGEPRKSVSYHE